MASNATRTQQTSGKAVPAAVAPEANAPRKATGYGLPCLKCHLYYPADLAACPTCKSNQRVPAAVPRIAPKAAPTADPVPDTAAVEHEREEFLRQFKSQLLAAQAEVAHAEESACKLREHDSGEPGGAEICQACYERLRERLDVCQAALNIDLKEAAQIIYDAVWADASDPNKTYQNAASALLTELRKRAEMSAVADLSEPFSPEPTP
jgi:hypothetical protein